MSLFSWARWLRSLNRPRVKTLRKKWRDFVRLGMDTLEDRNLMSGAPFITSVTPNNASIITIPVPTNPPPVLAVSFNEDMSAADVSNAANYLIFNSEGVAVPVNTANYNNNGGAGPFTVTLSYNSGQPLTADTYTLLLRGDQIHDTSGVAMAAKGQLVVANQNSATLSVVGVNGANDSKLQASTNYTIDGTAPTALLLVDDGTLSGSFPTGILDMIVASGSPAGPVVNIFSGRFGGGFFATPTVTITLPAGAQPTDLAVGDFDGKNGLDLAVAENSTTANANGEVTVYLSSSLGVQNYGPANSLAGAGQNPVTVRAVDVDGDGNLDLAVLDRNIGANGLEMRTLPGNGAGGFGAGASTVLVALPLPPQMLTSMDSFEKFNPAGTFRPDFAITTNFGNVYYLKNTSVVGTISFTQTILTGSQSATTVTAGDINGDFISDIVTLLPNGQLRAWIGPNFTGAALTLGTINGGGQGRIAIGDFNNDTFNDMVVTDGFAADQMDVFIQSAATPGTFAAPVPYLTDSGPGPVAIGDTNSDGFLDVVTANRIANDVTVFRGASTTGLVPDGTFWDDTKYSTGNFGSQPQGVATGDLNGDGLPDTVVADSGSDEIGVFLSTGVDVHGLIKYAPIVHYIPGGIQPFSVAIGDFDGVNGPDIAVSEQLTNDVAILLNNGAGGFSASPVVTVPVGRLPNQVITGDFNKDGKIDFAVAHNKFPTTGVTMVLGNGDGTFQPPTEIGNGARATSLATADFNHDGNPDLVIGNDLIGSEQLNILLGDGLGGFTPGGTYFVSENPDSLAIADFNRDGFADIVVASGDTSTNANIQVLINTLGTGFEDPAPLPVFPGAQIQSVMVTDVNVDAFPDIVISMTTANNEDNNLFVILNKGDGLFTKPLPYFVGGAGGPPSFGTVASDPFITATTFTVVTTLVGPNLLINGTFDVPDLNKEAGSLTGWQTYAQDNSAGGWSVQAANDAIGTSTSPLSGTPVDAPPQGNYAAMLDEADVSLPSVGPVFAGTHVLYQDVTIPPDDPQKPTISTLSFQMYYNTFAQFSDPNVNKELDYTNFLLPNQQIRVDIVDAPIQFSDNFNRADNTDPGMKYTSKDGDLAIKNNALVTTSSSAPDASIFNVVTPSDVTEQVDYTLAPTNSSAGLIARYDDTSVPGTTTYYLAQISGNASSAVASINKVVNGNVSLINNSAQFAPGKGTLRFDVQGNSLKLYVNNVLILSTTDSTITKGGFVGIRGRSAVFDNFSMATIAQSPRDVDTSVLQNVFLSDPAMPSIQPYTTFTMDMSAYKGRTVRLRFAATNNQDVLILGVDAVHVDTIYVDSTAPTLSNIALRNPGFGAAPGFAGNTSDPTITGRLSDDGEPKNVAFITAFATNVDDGTTTSTRINKWDAQGNFTLTLPVSKAGTYDVRLQATDRAGLSSTIANTTTLINGTTTNSDVQKITLSGTGGTFALTFKGQTTGPLPYNIPANGGTGIAASLQNALQTLSTIGQGNVQVTQAVDGFTITFTGALANADQPAIVSSQVRFALQGPSVTSWEAQGPGPISTRGVNFPTVSGRVTGIAVDPRDTTGNTFYIGSANGGVWKTVDGGRDYTPLTDRLVDASGNAMNVPIGAIALNPKNPDLIYAGTGVADAAYNSYSGQGVLKSTDGGLTWKLMGSSVFNGARISKIAVAAAVSIPGAADFQPERIYVAVAAGGNGPGLYRSEDGGVTWINVLDPANMFLSPNPSGVLGAGTPLGSVTDVVINPFNTENVYVGIGNIGLLAPSVSGGVWFSSNNGGQWQQLAVGVNRLNVTTPSTDDLPSGVGVGRVTISIGTGRLLDSAFVYVLMANAAPFPLQVAPSENNTGDFQRGAGFAAGLYASRNKGDDWTSVQLRQPNPNPAGPANLNYVDIDLMSNDGGYAGALTVDPTDPYVIFVGGSRRLAADDAFSGVDQTQHSLLRVDTRDMRDAQTQVQVPPALPFTPNDGDAYNPALAALKNGGNFPTGTAYSAVGMPWYDLERNVSNTFDPQDKLATTIPDRLPATIHGLVIDPQGRLLIATDGGLWRANSVGYADARPVDFTDASGRSRKSLPLFGSNLVMTALNGNLQITDLNSVAIDPTDRNTIYSAQAGSGFAKTTGPLTWETMALSSTNLIDPTKVVLHQMDGGVVRVAPADPGAPPGSPTLVYTTWQYADFSNGIGVQASAAGGAFGSFVPINNGVHLADQGTTFLPISINPNKEPGSLKDEILYGTDHIYETDNGGNTWDIFARSLTAAEGRITAVAMAPSGTDGFYIGTDQGRMFVDLQDGNLNFPDRTNQLPGTPNSPINSIAVYPGAPVTNTQVTINGTTFQRQNIAFVALGGTGTGGAGHVWRTTDGGLNWVNVTANLPDVPASSVVISDKPQLGGTPGEGAVYVATQKGVFYSLDFGTSWRRLGVGMPNVPVVDLSYNPTLDVLAAGTRGRGVFTIDTSAISFIPDQVINEDTPTTIPFTVNDPGLASGSYTITASSSNGALVPNTPLNIILGGSGQNHTIKLVPAPNANGVCDITIVISANGAVIGKRTFQLTVTPVNDLPTITNIGPKMVLEDQTLSLAFKVGDVETQPGALIVAATSSNQALVPDANLVLGGSGVDRTLDITPLAGQTGEAVITLTVTDADGGVTTQTFNLLVTVAVTLPFSDDFNRPDSIFLGPGWNSNAGNFTVAGNQASAVAGVNIATLNLLSIADISLQADVAVTGGKDVGFVARYIDNKNFYSGRISATTVGANTTYKVTIAKTVKGVTTTLASATVGSGTGTLRFDVAGSSLKMFFAPGGGPPTTLVANAFDSTFKLPSLAGLYTAAGNVTADNFAASAISVAPPVLPFTDGFSQPDGSQLSQNWRESAGNFSIQNNGLNGQLVANSTAASQNMATVNGLLANSSVQVDITLIPGQEGGVIARFTSAGMYYARIVNTLTSTTATIVRIKGGVITNLTAPVTVLTGIGTNTVRLEVAGPSLKLFFGPVGGPLQFVAYAYDNTFASGTDGVRAKQGVKFDNFVEDAINLLIPPVPFTDDFTQTDGTFLSRNWNDKAGDFTVQGGALVGNNSVTNMATINGVLDNGAIAGDFTLDPVKGQQAGLVARFGTSGYYYAQLLMTSPTTMTASILKVSGGGLITALTSPVPVATGLVTLRFEVVGTALKLFNGSNLIAYTFNSSFTSGTFGVRATKGATTTIDKVGLDSITLTVPTLPFTDDFATGPELSTNWSERQGNFTVSGGVVTGNNATANLATVNGTLGDSFIQADIVVGLNQQAGLVARYNAANGAMYYARIQDVNGTTTAAILKIASGKTIQLGAAVVVGSGTGTLRFEAVGPSLKLFYGPVGAPVLVTYAFDATLTSGLDGIKSTKNATFDNVSVDQIALLTPTLPFSDDFNLADGSQLSRNWDERAGNFTVTGHAMIGQNATTNLATVHGVSLGDVAVQADVTVGLNQQAAVVARYTAANGSMYVAQIQNTSGVVTARIFKIKGSTVQLAQSAPLATGTGTLRFEVVQNNLKLFFTNGGPLSVVAFAYDASPLAAGAAGIRSNKGASLANFSLDAITLVTPPLTFTDDFGTDGQLSRNWLENAGNFTIAGGVLTAAGTGVNLATVNGPIPDSGVQADISVAPIAGQAAGVVARYSAAGYYVAQVSFNGSIFQAAIYKSVKGGALTAITTPVTVPSGNGTLRLEAAGPSLKLFYESATPIANGYDSAFTLGTSGVRLSKGSTIDNFDLSSIALTTPSLPFVDTFSPDGPLSRNWTERAGLFQILGGVLTGANATAVNIATVNGALADAAIQADVNVGNVKGNQAGLIARYSASGYYLAVIQETANMGAYEARIYKVVGSTLTTLGTPVNLGVNVSGTLTGAMRFEVAGNSLKLFFQPTSGPMSLTYANDSSFTAAGLAGVRTIGSAVTNVDNYSLAAINLLTPALPFSDDFTQPTGSQLSLDWLNRQGNYTIQGGALVGSDPVMNVATVNGLSLGNAVVTFDFTAGQGQQAGAVLRFNAANNSYYLGRVVSVGTGFQAEIDKIVGSTTTVLASAPVASGTATLSFQIVSNNLKLFYGPSAGSLTLAAFAYDSALTTGTTGVRSTQNTPIDNFVTDQITLPSSQTLPYAETFVANPPTQQLSSNWQERDGNYNLATGKAVGRAAMNLATLNGLTSADVDLQMSFNFTIVGQTASLVARYSGPGEKNMYLATVTYTSPNSYTISIAKNINGVVTTLGAVTTSSFSGTLRFQVVGTSLKAYVDGFGFPILSLTDKSISAAGSAGFRTSQDVEVANFIAN